MKKHEHTGCTKKTFENPKEILLLAGIEKGNSLMYRPAAFGGDKKEALTFYRKALKLMDKGSSLKCDWQKMLLRAFILKALYETNQTSEARAFNTEMKKDYGSMDWIKQFVGANLVDGK